MRPAHELVQVGCYLRQNQAEERGLVILAMRRPYWILEDEGLYCLYVEGGDAETVTRELENFETEKSAELAALREAEAEPVPGMGKANPFSLHAFVWAMLVTFAVQTLAGEAWVTRGEADARAILGGELWRTVTALTLHADFGHLAANIGCGLVFAWSLLPLLGTGWTWMGILASGAAGNLLNALAHRGGEHLSIGASTAVFGGLGLLVGYQIAATLKRRGKHRWRSREVLLPFAAGLALLAFLGVGDGTTERVDILAHGLGMLSGLGIGAGLGWARLPERTTPRVQKALAIGALVVPVVAWAWAWL